MTKGKELTVITDPTEYAVMKIDGDLGEVIAINLEGEDVSVFDLDRIKVPGGGGIAWEVPQLDGEIDSVKELEGIILYKKNQRTFWAESFAAGAGSPPDCFSDDGSVGIGTPGRSCSACPNNQFGSDGYAKACREGRTVFLLMKDSLLPYAIAVPPTSIRTMKKYFMRLASRVIPYKSVITGLTLSKVKSRDGIDYAQIQFNLKGRVPAEVQVRVDEMVRALRPVLDKAARVVSNEEAPF